jgi:5-methyltetrahydrofolate--homocysteine methyltransferase
MSAAQQLKDAACERILIFDGAFGTEIQRRGLSEADYRGALDLPRDQKGNNDILAITRPDVVSDITRAYFAAGADMVSTNTFSANRISQADYAAEHLVGDINRESARLARAAARDAESRDGRPRFVAGAIGPTNKTLSLSPDVNDPGFREVDFDGLKDVYREQCDALIEGGVDFILIETIFDTLNAKAGIMAAKEAGRASGRDVPLMISMTITDLSGRNLSGHTVEAFWHAVRHARPLTIGSNCSFGAQQLRPHVQALAQLADTLIMAYPNAGLPNELGAYDELPEQTAAFVREWAELGLVNILGGCCGSTPPHIAAIARRCRASPPPRPRLPGRHPPRRPRTHDDCCLNHGHCFSYRAARRCGRQACRRHRDLRQYRRADQRHRIGQVQEADHGRRLCRRGRSRPRPGREWRADHRHQHGRRPARRGIRHDHLPEADRGGTDIARVPFMIDSSKWSVIEAGLKCVSGKPIVNSISMKEGEQAFLEQARKVRDYGAAVVVMAFDEVGQADTKERKVEICTRAYNCSSATASRPEDIIFDPNIFAIATGIDEHRTYAVDFIEACREIRARCPGAHISGGLSNLSFSFRGNEPVRRAMHSVFLYHAIPAGLDMAIVNAGQLDVYDTIDPALREACEDVILNREPAKGGDATEHLIALAEKFRGTDAAAEKAAEEWRGWPSRAGSNTRSSRASTPSWSAIPRRRGSCSTARSRSLKVR